MNAALLRPSFPYSAELKKAVMRLGRELPVASALTQP
jgi:hypothetical protein